MSSIFGLGSGGSKWKAAEKTVLSSIELASSNPKLALDLLLPIVKKVTEEPSTDQRYLFLRATTFNSLAHVHFHLGSYAEAEQIFRENSRDWRTAMANDLSALVEIISKDQEMIALCILQQHDIERYREFIDTFLQWRTEQVRAAEQKDRPHLLLEIAFKYRTAAINSLGMETPEGDHAYSLKFLKMEEGIMTALLPSLSGKTLEEIQEHLARNQTHQKTLNLLQSPETKALLEKLSAYNESLDKDS